jgi:hypothetical protein
MDLYNEQRTLVHSGPLARKNRTNDASDWHVWNDVELQLLDNYGRLPAMLPYQFLAR